MFQQKNYLLIPSVPTPNGRLHLGHIGGPYLSADVLARYLHMSGHNTQIITGSDGFESYVTAQAAKEHKTPEQICHYYHSQIADDLNAMDIQVEYFVNPLQEQWKPIYQQWHQQILHQLTNKGITQSISEYVGWDEHHNRYQVGCWLTGNCPLCDTATESYFCEECGAHYRPEEVIQNNTVLEKKVENLFLRLPHAQNLHIKGINNKLEQLYTNFLKQQNNLFRLTANSDWGIKYNDSSTLFSYGFVYAYFLMLGELAGKLNGTNKNAFAVDSSVITICCFGHDNALPFLSSILGITSACEEYKPFDYYLVNYFYNLNGSKFSTSRRNAIWVNDVIKHQQLSSDIIRLYLSSIDVRQTAGNFVFDDFINYYNNTIAWIKKYITVALTKIPETKSFVFEGKLQQKLNQLLAIQEKVLQPDHFFPHEAVYSINNWLSLANELNPNSEQYFWWLQTFSLFLYPFMPRLAKALWAALGYQNTPMLGMAFADPELPLQRYVDLNLKLIRQDLKVSEGELI